MAGDDTDTGTESAPDQQAPGDTGESKPEGKKDDGKAEGKGKDDKKPDSKAEGKGKDDKKPDSKKDDEQERKDQFAEAAEDPLADALGGASSRAGESQAYRSWIRTVRASSMNRWPDGIPTATSGPCWPPRSPAARTERWPPTASR